MRCGVVVDKDFLVVVVDDAAHVRHAAVADFHVVLVKDGVHFGLEQSAIYLHKPFSPKGNFWNAKIKRQLPA